MAELKILHLSDLHYDSSKPKDTQIILDALWKDLDNFPGIDFILFSGDLVKAGDKKDDFEEAFKVFIEPLFMKTGLNKDRFFMVPGNHDIQKNSIDEITEAGLKVKLTNRDSLNSFLEEEIKNNFRHIERLENFNNFKTNTFERGYRKTFNTLFTSHVIDRKNIKIGIACLNSAWRATGIGNENDYGKILIGERQVEACLNDMTYCDIKIALFHHPLDWLSQYDQIDMETFLFKKFDFIFCGHLHQNNLKMIRNLEDNIIVIQGGTLNKGRSSYNGYCILSIDFQKRKSHLHLRTYFDGRRKFDKAIDRCEDGAIVMNLKKCTKDV